jgi:hypothetical protein
MVSDLGLSSLLEGNRLRGLKSGRSDASAFLGNWITALQEELTALPGLISGLCERNSMHGAESVMVLALRAVAKDPGLIAAGVHLKVEASAIVVISTPRPPFDMCLSGG